MKKVIKCAEGGEIPKRVTMGGTTQVLMKDGGDVKQVLKDKGIDPSIVRKGIRYKGEDRGDYTTNFAPKIGVRTGKLIPLADYIKQKDAEKATADAAAKPSYQLTDQKISWEQPIQTPTVQTPTIQVPASQASGSPSTKPIKTSPSNSKTNTQKSSNSSPSQTEQKVVVPPVEQKSFPTNQKFGSQPYNDDMGTNSSNQAPTSTSVNPASDSTPIDKKTARKIPFAKPAEVTDNNWTGINPNELAKYGERASKMTDDELYGEYKRTFTSQYLDVLEKEREARGVNDWKELNKYVTPKNTIPTKKTIPATSYPSAKSYNFSKPQKSEADKPLPKIKTSKNFSSIIKQ